MVTCSMCIAVNPKNVAANCGTPVEIFAYSLSICPAGLGNPGSVSPSWISLVHSMPCRTMNAVPNAIVANSQFRVQARSCRCAANTAITMVSELDNRQAVITVALMMLSLPNGVGHTV